MVQSKAPRDVWDDDDQEPVPAPITWETEQLVKAIAAMHRASGDQVTRRVFTSTMTTIRNIERLENMAAMYQRNAQAMRERLEA